MDWIQLSGLRIYGYTGALPEEQVLGQWFEVNLKLGMDLLVAGQSDRLEDTLDYRSVIAAVKQLVQTSKFVLIEKLAQAIAETALEFPLVAQVEVSLSKLAAPIPDFGGTITIMLTRNRNQSK